MLDDSWWCASYLKACRMPVWACSSYFRIRAIADHGVLMNSIERPTEGWIALVLMRWYDWYPMKYATCAERCKIWKTHTQHTCRVFWVMRFWSLLGDCCVSITVLLWDRQNCRTEFSLREIFVTAGLLEASYSLLLSLAMCNPHDVRTVILKQLTCRQPVEHCRLRAQDLILCED
jgi:hypothetical protein